MVRGKFIWQIIFIGIICLISIALLHGTGALVAVTEPITDSNPIVSDNQGSNDNAALAGTATVQFSAV